MESSRNIYNVPRRFQRGVLGTKLAVVCGAARLSHDELAQLTARAANSFRNLALSPGDRVALLLLDGPEFIASFYGAAGAGLIPVPLNTTLTGAEYDRLVQHSGARLLVVSAQLAPLVQGITSRCPTLAQVVVTGNAEGAGWRRWDELVAASSPDFAPVPVSADEPAFWLYSSGSGGRPKAVVHNHASIPYTCEHYAAQLLGLRPDDLCFSAAKLFHAYGLGNGMNFPLSVGAATVLWPGPALGETLLEIIARERPTVFYGTPAHYVGMLGAMQSRGGVDLGSLRLCVSAGEALPAAVFERWREQTGQEILDGLGSTEMLHIFVSNRPGEARAGASGRPVPGYEVRVLNERGETAAPDVIGDLWVRGGSAMREYRGDPAATAAVMLDGWMRTGDKYRRDGDGLYWFQGRSDDMLKVNGIWVSPGELEQTLSQHPGVRECAVVGLPDDDGLFQIKAFVVLREGAGSPELARQLRAFMKQRAPGRYPREYVFVESLPKTATGKIKRALLREREVAA